LEVGMLSVMLPKFLKIYIN